MKAPVHVSLIWSRIEWRPSDTWKKNVLPRLLKHKIDEAKLNRSVYVIRLAGEFAVDYPKGQSPAVYIGEGNFNARINAHKNWVLELKNLAGDFALEVCVATPRVKKSELAYRDCEAALIDRFAEIYGSAPLWNKQYESRLCPHYEYSHKKMDEALRRRSGSRYLWSVKPMPSSSFYEDFQRTHRA